MNCKGKVFSVFAALACAFCMPNALSPVVTTVNAEAAVHNMYRLYNPNSGEHFFTANEEERDNLSSIGWSYEGVAWIAPETSNTPVYRLYNGNGGEHHYTTSMDEAENLTAIGWSLEGIGWYSDDVQGQALYRVYNPNAFANNHHYTTSTDERDNLTSISWNYEGIGWFGVDPARVHTETVHHDAVSHLTTVVDKEAYDENISSGTTPGYSVTICNLCGKAFVGENQVDEAIPHCAVDESGYHTDFIQAKLENDTEAVLIEFHVIKDGKEYPSNKAFYGTDREKEADDFIASWKTDPWYTNYYDYVKLMHRSEYVAPKTVIHHDALTHQETVVDQAAYDETVMVVD